MALHPGSYYRGRFFTQNLLYINGILTGIISRSLLRVASLQTMARNMPVVA
ncbi:hypothetical protein H4V96_003825 [Janthinobacterium sp. CG_23.4]|jgi:hypothetical protein|nr:hypothetical protein [Janthinobacterium sp. CG_23.4]